MVLGVPILKHFRVLSFFKAYSQDKVPIFLFQLLLSKTIDISKVNFLRLENLLCDISNLE